MTGCWFCADLCVCFVVDRSLRPKRRRHDRRGAHTTFIYTSCVSDCFLQITLRGRVGPVGGIKEKVLGAHRAHVKTVILPWANRKDVEQDVPPEIRSAMRFVFVRTMEETLEAAFGKGVLGWRRDSMPVIESRL